MLAWEPTGEGMIDKRQSRLRRARQTRARIAEQRAVRLTVHRSNLHIYAQVIDASGSSVIASASTLDKELRAQMPNGGNVKAAALVGQRIAQKAREKGIEKVAFDRSGYKYHGRVKALAEAAREAGLKF
jgi:large subunit ribosomal protein L18